MLDFERGGEYSVGFRELVSTTSHRNVRRLFVSNIPSHCTGWHSWIIFIHSHISLDVLFSFRSDDHDRRSLEPRSQVFRQVQVRTWWLSFVFFFCICLLYLYFFYLSLYLSFDNSQCRPVCCSCSHMKESTSRQRFGGAPLHQNVHQTKYIFGDRNLVEKYNLSTLTEMRAWAGFCYQQQITKPLAPGGQCWLFLRKYFQQYLDKFWMSKRQNILCILKKQARKPRLR